MEENDVEEIEIKGLFCGIRVAKRRTVSPSTTPATQPEKVKPEKKEKEEEVTYIKAPMVGTFYRTPSPGAPSYVEVGDRVAPGKAVCIIEAMKVMNEIESDIAGIIKEVLVKNEDPVEYGQPLFRVEVE